MSAPTPPSRLPQHPAHHRPTGPRGPRPALWAAGRTGVARTHARPRIRRRHTAFDIVARIGTAVTLAAVLVVITTALAMVDATPTPAGVSTTDRR